MYSSDNYYIPVTMSGSAILTSSTVMQDSGAHPYNSFSMDSTKPLPQTDKSRYQAIAREPPDAIPLTERPRFWCTSSKKVMTLILMSACLWIIVLDIMLVIYKSQQYNNAQHLHSSDLHSSAGMLSSDDAKQKQKFTAAPSGGLQIDTTNLTPLTTDPPALSSKKTKGKRFAVSIIEGSVHSLFPSWLSPFHHRNLAPSPQRMHDISHTTADDSSHVTTPSIILGTNRRQLPPPLPLLPFEFHSIIPPPPPPFLPLPERLRHFREPHPRRPWLGHRGARERAGPQRSDSARPMWEAEDVKGDELFRPRPLLPPVVASEEGPEPFSKPVWTPSMAEEDRAGKPWPFLEQVDEARTSPLSSSSAGKVHEEKSDLSNFFMKLITSLIGGPENVTAQGERTTGDHDLPITGGPELKLLKISRDDNDSNDDDSEDTIIDIDIFPEKR